MWYNISYKISNKKEVVIEGCDTITTPNLRHKIADFITDLDFDDSNEVEIKINKITLQK